jgi:hypothetical protein
MLKKLFYLRLIFKAASAALNCHLSASIFGGVLQITLG